MKNIAKPINIAIVGLGPRGLCILERLIANLKEFSDASALDINVHLFDPNMPGSGCHSMTQPDYFLVNTVASQITQFSDPSVQDAGPVLPGPSFYEWLVEYKKDTIKELIQNAYYSRALFGEYLHWVFYYLLDLCPNFINIFHYKKMVLDVSENDDCSWLLHMKEEVINVDFIYLTTGHTFKKPSQGEKDLAHQIKKMKTINPLLDMILNPYPVVEQLSNIHQAYSVAIEGAGLTTCDIIAELTVGRGGHFDYINDKFTYHPSGKEPKILIISRSGIPLSARAINQKGVDGQYKPRIMTVDNIQSLKMQHGKLDFEKHVFPLLYLEMSYVYYMTLIKNQQHQERADQFSEAFINAVDSSTRDKIINQFVAKEHHFDWCKLLNPVPENLNQGTFMDWLYLHLKGDIKSALQGNVDNPLKAACDVLRDVRDILRSAIDFSSLTEASHLSFIRDFVPMMNRLAVGPPYTRILEWIALMEAEVIQFNLGSLPNYKIDTEKAKFSFTSSTFESPTIHVDVLIKARVEMPSPIDDQSPLMQSMLQKHLLRPFKNGAYHPGGIEVNHHLNIIRANGEVIKSIWALGILTEGCKFYTFVVPRPGVNSTAIVDAGRAVRQMIAQTVRSRVHKSGFIWPSSEEHS